VDGCADGCAIYLLFASFVGISSFDIVSFVGKTKVIAGL